MWYINRILLFITILLGITPVNYVILQHCKVDTGSFTKDLAFVHKDLTSIIILDNSPGAYKGFPGKELHDISMCSEQLAWTQIY